MDKILQMALKEADAAEVFFIDRIMEPVIFESNRVKAVERKQVRGLGLRVIREGRIGFSSTSRLDDPEKVVKDAVAASEFSDPTNLEFGLAKPPASSPKVEDSEIQNLTVEDLVSEGQKMIKMVLGDFPEAKCDGEFSKEITRISHMNSAGMSFSYLKTEISGGLEVTLASEGDILNVYNFNASARRDVPFEDMAGDIVKRLHMSQRIAAMKTGHFPVIFTPRAIVFLLASLNPAFNGKIVLQGASPLRDKLGKKVFDEQLTVYDDGTLDYGSGSYPVDDEGVPTNRTPLIERGVVCNFIYDLKTASLAGTRSTGNGFRISRNGGWSFESQPSPSSTNLVIEPGDASLEEMISWVEEGLLVDQVLGAGQGNVLSGAFSMNVHLGFKIDHGKISGRVKNTMISGNLLESLQRIEAISDASEWAMGPYKVPAIMLGNVGVATGA
ncbi:MAG TPA: TldD/PmbA family protein [Firmicutes bacterium]|nr:TldD/PmbA family protein [Bacillota bacterium]HHY98093.1 TldD/PmbA family protein [Bacillota bacterium]